MSEAAATEPGTTPEPQIYVASLSDYNAGRLIGRWIDAAQVVEDIEAEISEMLAASPEPVAEEHAIHDYQGFGPLRLGEYEDLAKVSAVARGIVSHGADVVGAYVDNVGLDYIDPDTLEDEIAEHYSGHFSSLGEYAEQLAEDLGEMNSQHFERWPFTCIDWERAGRELELGGDIWTAEGSSEAGYGVHVFSS